MPSIILLHGLFTLAIFKGQTCKLHSNQPYININLNYTMNDKYKKLACMNNIIKNYIETLICYSFPICPNSTTVTYRLLEKQIEYINNFVQHL